MEVALQVVPGKMQEQSRQTAVRVGGALPSVFGYQEAAHPPLAMAQAPGSCGIKTQLSQVPNLTHLPESQFWFFEGKHTRGGQAVASSSGQPFH